MRRHKLAQRFALAVLGLCLAHEAPASEVLAEVSLFEDGQTHPSLPDESDPARIYRAWPFCPTDRMPCDEAGLVWIQMAISIDAYSVQRDDRHDSITKIVGETQRDLRPLVAALQRHFTAHGLSSELARLAFVQGLVQAVTYSRDVETGWTEYPKFGVEFLVDEQGDCDDAALTHTVLLEGLGYEAYLVNWDSVSTGREGHLSTAVRPDRGDLFSFSPPAGSRWVEAPGALRLLHVDAAGSTRSCGEAGRLCSRVGWNEWHQEDLRVVAVARPSDPALEAKMPLSAWNNGGRERPNRKLLDRRTATDEEIRQEVVASDLRRKRLNERLRVLGFDPKGVLVVPAKPIPAWQFYSILSFCLATLLSFAITALRRRRERLARVAALSRERGGRGW